ncbi:MAG TPA: Ig-like domain-containing protein [Nocardioides sp.]|uniref:Ig-like domain-containing protein n=1 Tax=Nocardioides sp. TaxID=35761 RepID=UPI002E36DADD|nr:Ig-like domain-containing protein [Nocardioides sp.]HEX5087113.1 Ig-like domain-containing protein [Nocardioides sp.]
MFQSTTAVRRGSLLLVTLALGAAPLVAVPTAAAGSHSAKRWAGYEISRTGDAAGGWIGGYAIGDTPVFLVTPTRKPNHQGYQRARVVDDLDGRRGASRAQTKRAAWILSKYGGYRDAAQAAAVDATVYAVLVGGRFSTSGALGARRIHQAPDSATVLRFARIMLSQSRRHAGPYHARVKATSADAGGAIEATVKVTDGHGRPAAGLPVSVDTPGAPDVEAVTGDNGKAVARFAVTEPGWHRVTAKVRDVPEDRLHLRLPVRHGQAAAAEGGVRRTLVASTRAAVRGSQALGLQASPDTILVGSPARVTATVNGDGTSRTATGTLYGPFSSASAAQCSGPAVGTVNRSVSADGGYPLPALTPSAPGYYVWRVALQGTPTALPVAACGAVTTVKALATISVTALNPELPAGDNAQVRVGLSGLPHVPAVDLTLTVYGPYGSQQALTCSGTIATSVGQKMNGDGTVTLFPFIEQGGWYALQATVPPGELRQGSQSSCGALGTVLHAS